MMGSKSILFCFFRKASSTKAVPELHVSGSKYGKKAEEAARREKEKRWADF